MRLMTHNRPPTVTPPADVNKLFRIDTGLMERVRRYRHSRMLRSEGEAFRQLIAAGLDTVGDGQSHQEMETART